MGAAVATEEVRAVEREQVRWHWNGTQCLVPEDCSEDWGEESSESESSGVEE
jgi:hypothetical protein